jgi:hypothetical protein
MTDFCCAVTGACGRLSQEQSRDLQHVLVSNDSHKGASTAAAAAAVAGEAAGKLAMGQPTAVPAPFSTEAAAAAAVGTGAGVTRRRGWFGRKKVGTGSVADGKLAITKDGEENPKEEPVKVQWWQGFDGLRARAALLAVIECNLGLSTAVQCWICVIRNDS